jgi:gliding motility-associated lipoprotein GldH
MNQLLKLSLLFLLLVGLISCDNSRIFEDNTPIENNVWKVNKPVTYSVDISDTVSPCNFYLNVRHDGAYDFSNLFIFLKTQFPNGKMAKDTVELLLQTPEGKWTGKGLGDICDNQIMFKKGLRFPLKGKYTFSIEQAMRMAELPNIIEIGMRIEKSK